MDTKSKCITPFMKQCFVTTGVNLNFLQFGLVVGFTSSLLPQLRAADSIVPIDDSSGSWIAAMPAISMFPANFFIPLLMGKFGRKLSSITSVVSVIISWLIIAAATDLTMILIGRLIQGIALGIAYSLSPILIGEYTSPSNRGAFLATLSLVVAVGTHVSHSMAVCLYWQTNALICAGIAFADLIIVIYSPESPSWLIDKGRYEDSRNVFRWLRGDGDDDELGKMIEVNTVLRETKLRVNKQPVTIASRMKSNIAYLNETMRKPEFYKPIIVVTHLNMMILVSGSLVLASYATDVYDIIVGSAVNVPLVMLGVDTQRLVSSTFAIYVIKKVKRKAVLSTTVTLNILTLLFTAGYTYAKSRNTMPDYPFIGVSLIHLHMFSIAFGTIPVPLIISGEILPLRYRSLGSMIGSCLNAPINFVTLKTVPFLMRAGGLHGAYFIYACIVLYSLIVAWILLPETKDKTLQDIEDEFRGRKATVEVEETVKLRGNQAIL